MTDLTNFSIAQVYEDYITLGTATAGTGLTNTLVNVQDGLGQSTPMQISLTAVNFSTVGGNSFQINGVPLSASSSRLNQLTQDSLVGFAWSTAALVIPDGDAAERPVLPSFLPCIRFNTDDSGYECYVGSGFWKTFVTSASTTAFSGTTDALNSITDLNKPEFIGTGALVPPVGTTAERPGVNFGGEFRYNSQTNQFEGFVFGTGWKTFNMT